MQELPFPTRRALRRDVRKEAWQAGQEWLGSPWGLSIAALWAGLITWAGIRLGQGSDPDAPPGGAALIQTVIAVAGVVAIPVVVWSFFFVSAWRRKAYSLKADLLAIEVANEPITRGCRTVRAATMRVAGSRIPVAAILIAPSTRFGSGTTKRHVANCVARLAGAAGDQVDEGDLDNCFNALSLDGLLDRTYIANQHSGAHIFQWSETGRAVALALRGEMAPNSEASPSA